MSEYVEFLMEGLKKVRPTRKSIEADPRVESLIDERPGGWYCNLASGYNWSGQRSFGAETLADIARLVNETEPDDAE
jgi:hypothetical protein